MTTSPLRVALERFAAASSGADTGRGEEIMNIVAEAPTAAVAAAAARAYRYSLAARATPQSHTGRTAISVRPANATGRPRPARSAETRTRAVNAAALRTSRSFRAGPKASA